MICPHCKKSIGRTVSKDVYKKAEKYRNQGHSLRDIEKLLFLDNHRVSPATLCRHFAALKKAKRAEGRK